MSDIDVVTTNSRHEHPISRDLLMRRFSFEHPNQAWVGGRSHMGNGLTEAEYTIESRDAFVRVQVMDARGRSAWTSPVAIRRD